MDLIYVSLAVGDSTNIIIVEKWVFHNGAGFLRERVQEVWDKMETSTLDAASILQVSLPL